LLPIADAMRTYCLSKIKPGDDTNIMHHIIRTSLLTVITLGV
jgi:hypothetical protein